MKRLIALFALVSFTGAIFIPGSWVWPVFADLTVVTFALWALLALAKQDAEEVQS